MPSIRSLADRTSPNCPRPTVALQRINSPCSNPRSASKVTVLFGGKRARFPTPVDTAQTQLALPCSNTTCAKLMDRPPKSDTLRPGRTGPIACWCPGLIRELPKGLESASAREHRTFERRCARCGQNRLIAPYGCGLCNPGGSNREPLTQTGTLRLQIAATTCTILVDGVGLLVLIH